MGITARTGKYLFVLILFIACAITYGKSLSYDFVFDDLSLVVNNPYIKDIRRIGEVFKKDLFVSAYDSSMPNYYRPLQTVSFMLEYRLWKLQPRGYHITNIALHFLNALLLFVLVFLLFDNFFIAGFSGLMFCVHPIQTIVVSFISDRADLLVALFILCAFICYVLLSRYNNRAYVPLIVLFCVLALFSRENAIFIPAGILLLSFFCPGGKKHRILCVAATTVTVIFFLYLRVGLMHIPIARHAYVAVNHFFQVTNFLYIVFSYISLLVMPLHLYLMHVVAPIHSASDIRLWLAFGFFIVSCIFWYAQRRNSIAVFGLLWFSIFIAQVFPLMTAYYGRSMSMNEHWVYLASAGLFVAAGGFFNYARRFITAMVYPLVIIIVIIFSVITQATHASFKDRLSLAQRIVRFDPDNKEAQKELADIYLAQKKYAQAREHLDRALRISSTDSDTYLLLGSYYEETGNTDQARATYEKIITIDPRSARAYNNLGALYFSKKDFNTAKSNFRAAMELNPMLYEPRINMAKLCAGNNEIDDAVSFFMQAIRLNPDNSQGYVQVAKIYLDRGMPGKALENLRRGLAAGQRDATILVLLGVASTALGSDSEALSYFQEAMRQDPRSEDALFNLGVFYANHNNLVHALAAWDKALAINPSNALIRENIAKARELLSQQQAQRRHP